MNSTSPPNPFIELATLKGAPPNILPLGNKSHKISPKQIIVVEFITILSKLFTRFKLKEI
jgi:hypothetical protein